MTTLRGALAEEGTEAMTADEHPLRGVVEAGRTAWAWRTVDEELAELAELVYDSADQPALAGLRGGQVPPRHLTFEHGATRLELEVGADGMLGQILPPQLARIQLQGPDGPGRELDSDGQGRFVVEPALTGPVRLRCSLPDADSLVTGWVLL
jgi:hypothetical protein